jgi:regulatory protein NPR1
MKDLVAYGSVGYEAFIVFLHYLYTGKLKAPPTEVTTCVDEACIHDACRPAIDYALELMYASSNFKMKELVLLFQVYILLCFSFIFVPHFCVEERKCDKFRTIN